MAHFSLVPYTLRVFQRDPDSSGYVRLRQRDRFDFLSELGEFANLEPTDDEEAQSLLRCNSFRLDGALLEGLIETGDYGYRAELINVADLTVAHRRLPTEAELLPFYALFEVPEVGDEGLVVLQRFQQFGVKTALSNALNRWLKTKYPRLTVQLNPIVPRRLWDAFEAGRVTAIRYIRYEVPTDLADAYREGDHVEVEGYTELVVRARQKRALPLIDRVLRVIKGEASLSEVTELVDFEADDVKVEVDLGGTRRTVDLGNPTSIRPSIDITDDVATGDDGHPVFADVSQVARSILAELRSEIGGGLRSAGQD